MTEIVFQAPLFEMEPTHDFESCIFACVRCHKGEHKSCVRPHRCHGTEEELTAGAKLKRKQEALIAVGLHPLSYLANGLRVFEHPVTETTPTCGDCRFRQQVHGGSRSYPKCLFGYTEHDVPEAARTRFGPRKRIIMPRVTHGTSSDCRAWWPACTNYEEKTDG